MTKWATKTVSVKVYKQILKNTKFETGKTVKERSDWEKSIEEQRYGCAI